jgi:hypothetical protein
VLLWWAREKGAEQVKELLSFLDGPTKSERSSADIVSKVVCEVGYVLGPFVEGKATAATIGRWNTKNQVSGCDTVTNGVEDARSQADDSVVVDEHGVMMPKLAIQGDTMVAGVGDGRSKTGHLSCGGGWRKADLVGKGSRERLEISDIGEAAAKFRENAPERR